MAGVDRKDEQKRRREARQTTSEFALHCSSDGCGLLLETMLAL